MRILTARLLASFAFALITLGTANAQTTYFSSDFNAFPDSATIVNGGSNSLSAYGLPTQFGIIRPDGSGGKALTIYGGEDHNGAASGAFAGLAARIAEGQGLLRMTGVYRTTNAFDGTPWAQTGRIQFQNNQFFFPYNELVVTTAVPDWTPFTLDLDLGNLDPGQLGQVQANFYLPSFQPGELQVDNLTVQTVPEPSTYAMLAVGAIAWAGGMIRRRRR